MSRTSTLLALVATAALGLTMTIPNADAAPAHGHYKHFGHKHFGKHGPWWKHHHHHWRPRYYVRPIYRSYAAPVVTTAVATAPVSCLSKEYTPQGAVLFKDRCTNEWAMNPPLPGTPQ